VDERGGDRLRISLRDLRPPSAEREAVDPRPLKYSNMMSAVTAAVDAQESMAETLVGAPPETQPPPLPPPPRVPARTPPPPSLDQSGAEPYAEFSVGQITRDPGAEPWVIAGRYQVEAPIGEGGMGRVYRVRHLQLGKPFALKLIATAFSSDSRARDLFYSEARLASSLAHPNVVSVIDFGEDPELGAFMVMELLEGETLSNRLRESRVGMRVACDLILQVAEALQYIHKRQIVHCDIKPDNILLMESAAGERRRNHIKLLDFGLARGAIGPRTSSQGVDGTPEYLAPERIVGGSPHPSMDIYGIGVLAYEIFTGSLPFTGQIMEVLNHHLQTPPPPFATRSREPIDERAEALVMKAMSKDPSKRQKDMAAFVYELRTLMDMLGFGRRRAPKEVQRVGGAQRERRTRAAAASYDLSPLPMAGLNVDGLVVVANRAFAQFVSGDPATQVEGVSVDSTGLLEIHPGLSADLRHVHVSGQALHRALDLTMVDDRPIRLMLWLVPGNADAGEIQLTVQVID
jgi:hypothetical protein